MANPITRAAATAALIESGRVLDVNIDTWTLTVTTEFTKKPHSGVRFATPYQHHANGEGIYFMPEVGSICWVCFPSDGNKPFVLGWGAVGQDSSYRDGKRELNPGDIFLGTRDENFLYLRRGGIVQIGGGPLSQRMYLPINNTIKDFCENYQLNTLGGDLTWTVGREESTTDGKRPALFRLLAREFANDPQPVAELLVGSHGEGDKTILSLTIKASGSEGAAQRISLKMDKEGGAQFVFEKDVDWEIKGKLSLRVKGEAEFKSEGNALLESKKGMKVKAGTTLDLLATGVVNIEGKIVNIGKVVRVGGGSLPVILASKELIQYLTMHVHPVIGPGLNSGPPLIGPPGSTGGSPFLPALTTISKKLISG